MLLVVTYGLVFYVSLVVLATKPFAWARRAFVFGEVILLFTV
jgi:hypothetical protein